jgi:hypothetical protein
MVQAQAVEAESQRGPGHLGGVAVALVRRVEHVADLAGPVLLVVPEQHHVAHQLAAGAGVGQQAQRLAGLVQLAQRPAVPFDDLLQRQRPVRHEPGDVGSGLVHVYGRGVVGRGWPQQQPLGADRVARGQHGGDATV